MFCIYILQSCYHDGTPFSRQGGYTQGHKNVCLQNYLIAAFLWRIQSTPYKPSLFQNKNLIDDVSVLSALHESYFMFMVKISFKTS